MVCAPTTMYAYTIVDDAPPRVIHNWFVVDDVRPYNHVWLSHRGRCAPLATLKELRFPSPGLRAKLATLGKRHTNQATLSELRLAVGVNSFVEVYTTHNCPCAAVQATDNLMQRPLQTKNGDSGWSHH